MLKTTITPK